MAGRPSRPTPGLAPSVGRTGDDLPDADLDAVVVLAAWELGRQVGGVRRGLARVDRRLTGLLRQTNVPLDEFPALSERVKELARDPRGLIEAIRVFREETSAGLAEAKDAVEAFVDSVRR